MSPFAASRILEQRIYEPTNRRTAWPNDVKTWEVIKLKFLSMLFLYYILNRAKSQLGWILPGLGPEIPSQAQPIDYQLRKLFFTCKILSIKLRKKFEQMF